MLTSWNVPCGIFQYSARFADGLRDAGHHPVVLAGRGDAGRSVPEESDHEVVDVAEIGLWRGDGRYSLDVAAVVAVGLDVVHVQYQAMLFRMPDLSALRAGFGGRMAITFHDKAIHPQFPFGAFDVAFAHRAGVAPGWARVLPFGIEVRRPVVRTFGLGRSRSDLLAGLCDRCGWVFESAETHRAEDWRSHEELVGWLRGADAIVLWYDDNPGAGSSQAARTALAARRPVYVNDTEWFAELPFTTVDGWLTKVGSLGQLEAELRSRFLEDPYVLERSWSRVARESVGAYGAVDAVR